ncbi:MULTISPECIES: sodium-dependent transporter [Aeromonas]|jgi:NSS family neurotransmitter:Na+ symporter|uniref:Transporter n=1 Tax=Aeromonas caviae TaxID=648 RepID=A0AAV4YK51_AERCA|nr:MULTISPECIES: sodium-dependent transporter [Aeromonas]MBP9660977.1 sodium-dependent transporter [Aeromonas sp.]MBL0608129.1 sodium-dependent transporter [Aeromonas caviae]MDF2277590.1 sodium-dependent transporter [Aeromonas caviae]MDX7842219.1 sodium-dependent transporter [Aeromonas caviae]MEA9421981.1 sodium-dependent transporter [Aeromonas caviae]
MSQVQWSSRIGHVLAAAGSAIGLGAIWKFPYVTATNGGGAFLLVFLLFSFTLGVAVLVGETLLGSRSQRGVLGAFHKLVGPNWRWMGYMGILCGFFIYSFYSVVGGWTVGYAALAVGGELNLSEASTLTALFTGYVSDPLWPALTHLVFAGLTWWFVQGGLQQGVERALRWMMPALFVMMLLLVVTGLSMPGAMAGVRQFLMPDFSHLTGQGVLDALGLAFFSLSIGLGVHTTYGAYLPSSDGALRSGVWVVTLASCISVLAGLMIFPVLASTGIDPAAGPGLTFMTMPAVFNHLPFGQGLAVIFFLLLLVAALSSSISMLEHLVRFTTEEWGWSRRNACRVLTLLIMACGIPVSLSFGPWAEYTLFGKTLFDLLDYLTSNLMMPLFGLVLTLLLGWKLGDSIVPADLSPLMRGALLWCWRLVAPLLIAGILVRGLL